MELVTVDCWGLQMVVNSAELMAAALVPLTVSLKAVQMAGTLA